MTKNDTPQMKAIREYWAKYKAQYRAQKKLEQEKQKQCAISTKNKTS